MGSSRRMAIATMIAALVMAAAASLGGCGFLSTETPQPPSQGNRASPVPLTAPESTLSGIREGFRVGNADTYIKSIAESLDVGHPAFTAFFDPGDRAEFSSDPTRIPLLNGGWRWDQERNAMNSVMNTVSGAPPDRSRFQYEVLDRTGGTADQPRWVIGYQLNVAVGNAQSFEGTAALTFRQDPTGEWKILRWDDARKVGSTIPTWGKLRLQNIS